MKTIAERIVSYLSDHEEATIEDLVIALSVDYWRARKALVKLETRLKYIVRSGKRDSTLGGRKQTVYRLVEGERDESLIQPRAYTMRRIIRDEEMASGDVNEVRVQRHWLDVALFGEYRRVME